MLTYIQNYATRDPNGPLAIPETVPAFLINRFAKVETRQLEGRPHLVVPVVMIAGNLRDGSVMAGSAGPTLYPPDEVEKSAHLWNGRPIVRDHVYLQGVSTANAPEAFSSQRVGTVFNARYTKDGELAAEAWIDVSRADAVDRRIVQAIRSNKSVEVSTGLYADSIATNGAVNGRSYRAVARNFRPDHLAILLDSVGACSLQDGCGLLRDGAATLVRPNYSGRLAGSQHAVANSDPGILALPSLD